jgi:hypothetical protein
MDGYVQVIDFPTELEARSGLVRRLVRARDDAVKLRARQWLAAIDDAKLLAFGLSRQEIADLRGLPISL